MVKKTLAKLTHDELREVLWSQDVPIGGSKNEIVDRLKDLIMASGGDVETVEFDLDDIGSKDALEDGIKTVNLLQNSLQQ